MLAYFAASSLTQHLNAWYYQFSFSFSNYRRSRCVGNFKFGVQGFDFMVYDLDPEPGALGPAVPTVSIG